MGQNFRKIVFTSSELTHWCKVSQKPQAGKQIGTVIFVMNKTMITLFGKLEKNFKIKQLI
jgi:hypothetical protein